MEDVARQAFRVDADEDRVGLDGDDALGIGQADAAQGDRDVRERVDEALIDEDVEFAEPRGQLGLGDLADQAFLPRAVLDDLGDRADAEAVLLQTRAGRACGPWCRRAS